MNNIKLFKDALNIFTQFAETEPQIEQYANDLRLIPIYGSITDIEFEKVVSEAKQALNVIFGKSYSVKSDKKHIPWFDNRYSKIMHATRWERYVEYLRDDKHLPPQVIQGMEENLKKITDLLGDPNGANFQRRGLVVGDVQSGKTANYVGLMNLAADIKYKVMIVLTGTTNTLREQTQIRIEEGLGAPGAKKGVTTNPFPDYFVFNGKDPVYLTSDTDDFKKSSKKNFQLNIEATSVPIVIVTKKNTSSLKNIKEWLDDYSKAKNDSHIDSSLLLIDDEADFASVNTKSNENDDTPTQINRQIREILKLFTKSSYIGFTATPFANIFIDPDSDESMFGQDLFPEDYIYVLGESDTYTGVQSIFSDTAKNSHMLVEVSEESVETYLELKHKKDSPFNTLAPSMIDAVNLFFIANVIRDFRGDTKSHRSMLINISRFQAMHDKIKLVVYEQITKMQRDIRLYGKLPIESIIDRPTIQSLKESYDKHYKNLDDSLSFDDIIYRMNESVNRIHVIIVNANNKELDYVSNQEEGERVIIIGGFALSRGLTLEGLMISYYYRNSVMYDSLLQMGRWFGYRKNYEDLCRIFMTEEVITDFRFIALATQELKEDLETNSRRGLTPKDFGIRVRTGQAGLIITARNKMRTGKTITTNADFNNEIIGTIALTLDNKINSKNKDTIEKFISENKELFSNKLYPKNSKTIGYGLKNVDKSKIKKILKDYIPVNGSNFDSELINKWLDSNDVPALEKWDVAFAMATQKNNDSIPIDYGNGIKGFSRVFSVQKKQDQIYKINKSRLGSPSDGRYGLTSEEVKRVINEFSEENKSLSQKKYLWSELNRKPLLLIYPITPKDPTTKKIISDQCISLISISIPDMGFGKSHYVEYTVNKIYQDLDSDEIEVGEE